MKDPNVLIKTGRGLKFSSNSTQSTSERRGKKQKKIDLFFRYINN
jgi:hypothetical protein